MGIVDTEPERISSCTLQNSGNLGNAHLYFRNVNDLKRLATVQRHYVQKVCIYRC
jgi:hypothetical protein